MRNLDEQITRRQAMQEQVVAMLRSTTNKVCKTMTTIAGTGTISQARQELNDGIRGVRNLIRQLENDPNPYESILRTERNALGNFSKDIVCEMYGEKSEECLLACLAIDAGDAPGNTFTLDDLETAWDITQSPPVPIPGIDTCEGTDGVFIQSNPDWKPGDEIPDTIVTDSQIECYTHTRVNLGGPDDPIELKPTHNRYAGPGSHFLPSGLVAIIATTTGTTTIVAATTTVEAVDNILNSDCDTDGVFSVSCVCEKFPRVDGRKTLECELAESADTLNGTQERTGTFTADGLQATAAEPPFTDAKATPTQR